MKAVGNRAGGHFFSRHHRGFAMALMSNQEAEAEARAILQMMGAHGSLWLLDHTLEVAQQGKWAELERLKDIAKAFGKLAAEPPDSIGAN